jgi:uncharacterized protein
LPREGTTFVGMNSSLSANQKLAIYFSLAYLISWTIWLPLYAPKLGLPVLPFHHGWGGLGPLLASVICIYSFEGKIGVRKLIARWVQFKPIAAFALALFVPFVLLAASIWLVSLFNNSLVSFNGFFSSNEFPQLSFFGFFIYNLVFFGFGEEVGWRGFALPKLLGKHSPVVASIILTAFWAVWHWPLFYYRPGYVAMGFAEITGWFFSLLTGSFLFTWLYQFSKGSILACALFHSTVDIAFTSKAATPNVVNALGMLITLLGLGVFISLWLKNKKAVAPTS